MGCRRIGALGKRSKLDREIEDELREHLRMRAEVNLAQGMSPEQATRAGRLRFGNPAVFKERVGAEDAALSFDSLFRDVRYALRGFTRSVGFTAVAIITLALGIAANTAVFELLDALRLRSLPVQKPEELAEVRIIGGNRGFGITDSGYTQFTVPMYGVLSYFVTRRRNEIGIRIALGAKRRQVITLVMRDTAAMLLAGIVVGTALALLTGRAATALLFGVKPYDLATLGFAIALLAVIDILGSWLPARKASNLDPFAALRTD